MIKTRIILTFHFILIFYFVWLSNTTNCQPLLNVDSLKTQLVFQKDDTNKVKLLFLISKELRKTDPQSALKYSDNAQKLSENLNFIHGIIDALSEKGKCYEATGYYDSAFVVIRKAIELSESISDIKRFANNNVYLGNLVFRTEGPEKAYNYYLKSYGIYKNLSDSTGIANALNGLGVMLMQQTKYDSAVHYLLDYLRLSQLLNDEQGLGKGYINIGLTYSELGQYDKAEEYLVESIKINEKYNNQRFISIAYNNLGAIAYEKMEYDEALTYYQNGLEIDEKLENLAGIADRNTNIGNIYEKKNDYNNAYSHYSRALEIYEGIGKKDGLIAAYKNQGWIHHLRENYTRALLIYDSCLVLANKYNLPYRTKEIYWNIFTTYEKMGNYKKAFEYLDNFYSLNDSIYNIEKEETIANLTLKYEKEKDQALILSLENENLEKNLSLKKRTNQRNIYLFSGSGTIVLILFLFIFYRHKTRKDKIIAEQKIRQLEEEKKLLAAKSIVEGQEEERKRIAKELHDGLGVLLSTAKMQFTTIKDKSPENRPLIDKATKLLEQAASDVRKISHNMMPGLLTKFGLYEATEDLIEQLDETEGLNAICEITGDTQRLPENTEIMVYRIIQEMVNNTLKHAEADNIRLQMNILAEQLNITYSDDGKGFNIEEKLESKSIGLTSIQSRVNFLSGQVNLESQPGKGINYYMEIPVKRE
jgi:signal transduction histidine kinase/Tfp pilus assembly protein PilF